MKLSQIALLVVPVVFVQSRATYNALPQVDLGYSIVQAQFNVGKVVFCCILSSHCPARSLITCQQTGGFYSFLNVRYGEPPLGSLRFAASVPPQTVNRTVNNGSNNVICPQALPSWILALEGLNSSVIAAEPGISEDCLFLDVMVPQAYISKPSAQAPVMVWIYGGGYVAGTKSSAVGDLIGASQKAEKDGIIFVSINYRLGLFVSHILVLKHNECAFNGPLCSQII